MHNASEDLQLELRAAKQELKNAQALAGKRQTQVKAVQALSAALFSAWEEREVFHAACATMVNELKWDSAAAIIFTNGKPFLAHTYHVTQRQERSIATHLPATPVLTEVHAQKTHLSTYHRTDAVALALRALFHTNEVVAVPVFSGKKVHGYLVATAHTTRNHHRNDEDVQFLVALGEVVTHSLAGIVKAGKRAGK